MDALYAFARITDDLADEPGEPDEKRERLTAWSKSLNLALSGIYSHPIQWALHDSMQRFNIPHKYLLDVIDGVTVDLEPVRFATFAELRSYCYRVASAVGLACVRVWGVRPGVSWDEANEPVDAAGVALQLTNILRDLGEDEARGRSYIPADEMPLNLPFQIDRARDFYRQAGALDDLLTNEGRAIFRVVTGTYRALLERIAKKPESVFASRIRVSKWRKALIFLAAWSVKWGLR